MATNLVKIKIEADTSEAVTALRSLRWRVQRAVWLPAGLAGVAGALLVDVARWWL